MATRTITLEPIDIRRIELTIVGDSPLLVHKFSEKMRKAMLDKQNKQKASGREDRNPEEEVLQCMYMTEDGRPGFPAIAIKCAMVDAVSQVKGTLTKVVARQAIHIEADDPQGILPLEGDWTIHEATVRLPNGVADVRFRPMFKTGWRITFRIAYNARAVSDKQIVSLLQHAGFGVGIGDWRPEKNGVYGRFHVLSEEEGHGEAV